MTKTFFFTDVQQRKILRTFYEKELADGTGTDCAPAENKGKCAEHEFSK